MSERPMNYYAITYRYRRAGRIDVQTRTFAAPDLGTALSEAMRMGKEFFGRRFWEIIGWRCAK